MYIRNEVVRTPALVAQRRGWSSVVGARSQVCQLRERGKDARSGYKCVLGSVVLV
jgi:hypothetical protein